MTATFRAGYVTAAWTLVLGACRPPTSPQPVRHAASVDPAKAQITVLYDAFGTSPGMQQDWGYSALIEYGGKRILFDTGNNGDILAQNAKAKGVDLSQLDFVIISHRHGDHIGGLATLRKMNPMPIQMASNKTALPKWRNASTARMRDAAPLMNNRIRLPAETCRLNANTTCVMPVSTR